MDHERVIGEELDVVFVFADLSGYTALTEAHVHAAHVVSRCAACPRYSGHRVQGARAHPLEERPTPSAPVRSRCHGDRCRGRDRGFGVCRMQIVPGAAVAEATIGGRRYLFCSIECRDVFVADAEAR